MSKRENILFERHHRYLSEVMPKIPSETVIKKGLPGIGGTTLELESDRHSVIIEPNVPVILGKISGLPNEIKGKYLAVLENVSIYRVKEYLLNDRFPLKKILTTPESFEKVKHAMESLGIDMHSEYFLLFDECDRTSKDIEFRDGVILPMDDFFKFRNKAFISATATYPSDPMFEGNGFKFLEITPTYDHSRDAKLFATNNPKEMLRCYLQELTEQAPDVPVFIFFASFKGIVSVIEDLGIQADSRIFCSRKSRGNLKKGSSLYKNTHDMIDGQKIGRFNFLTSRFFSAVDIRLVDGSFPHVIVLTDLNVAEHSAIDPLSDGIQIPGRFRDGVSSIAFISNFNEKLFYRSPEEARNFIEINREFYQRIMTLRDISEIGEAKLFFNDAMKYIPFARFMLDRRRINYFMLDSYYDRERIKSYYTSAERWGNVFRTELAKYYRVSFNKMDFSMESRYHKVNGIKKFREMLLDIVDDLDFVMKETEEKTYSFRDKETVYNSIERNHPDILKAYRLAGAEKLIENGYCMDSIRQVIAECERNNARKNLSLIDSFTKKFYPGQEVLQKDALGFFRNLVDLHGLPFSKDKNGLSEFLEFEEKKNGKGTRYLVIKSLKFEKTKSH